MKRLVAIALVVSVLAGLIVGGAVYAGTLRAAKATAIVGDITWLEPNNREFETILDQPIRVPQQKDLFIDVSLLCGLFTQTEVTAVSQQGWDTGTAKAYIMARVYAEDQDGTKYWATPPAGITGKEEDEGIIFAMREQTMWAQLNTDNLSDNMTIGLALDTMDAHSFNFIIPDLPSGDYTVVVEAYTFSDPAGTKGAKQGGGDAAWAGIGYGSVTIEQVRMAKNTDIIEVAPEQ